VGRTEHHFLPKSRGGKGEDKKAICVDCHSAIHAFFDNKELESQYNTSEMTPDSVIKIMMADERFGKAIQFIAKQPPGKRHKTKRTKERQKQNKYR
jgi:phosphotransferase system HPr-like phosphotransfer protein